MKNTCLTLLVFFMCVKISFAPPVGWASKLFFGTEQPAAEQAKKLLRKINPVGSVSFDEVNLDADVAQLFGTPTAITRDQLKSYLVQNNIPESEVGGNIEANISYLVDTSASIRYAKYFVIHDTSFPRYGTKPFPADINEESWSFNNLDRCWSTPVTHIYVNRVGRSKTVNNFDVPVTATKLERYVLGEPASKGLYLHIEMIQPRRQNSHYWRHNDIECPTPGFSDPQYKRLALLYVTASVRKGEWMIPGFHANVDSGIRNSHDDPQGFELEKWQAAIKEVVAEISSMKKA